MINKLFIQILYLKSFLNFLAPFGAFFCEFLPPRYADPDPGGLQKCREAAKFTVFVEIFPQCSCLFFLFISLFLSYHLKFKRFTVCVCLVNDCGGTQKKKKITKPNSRPRFSVFFFCQARGKNLVILSL